MSAGNSCRFVIADDQILIREAISQVLRTQKIDFDVAKDGSRALELFQGKLDYDGAVLDQRMPELSGLEVIKSVRTGKTNASHDLPFLLITGHSEPAVVKAAAKLDVDVVLTKPFTTKILITRLKLALDRRKSQRACASYEAVALPSARKSRDSGDRIGPSVVIPGKPLWVTDAGLRLGEKANQTNLVSIEKLESGMVLGQSLYATNGRMIAGPGLKLNHRLIEKIRKLTENNESTRYIHIQRGSIKSN